jgi:hypothetical protein
MKLAYCFAFAASAVMPAITSAADASSVTAPERRPVLVELFTSEGCSSCPPADRLLEKLDHEQPIAGAHVIVLSEHVDYWNHDGWLDPFSSAAFTDRQKQYVGRLGASEPYTPEMVVDGTAEFTGNDARKADAAIQNAAQQPKVAVRISQKPGEAALTIEADALPPGAANKADVYLVQALDSATSDVARGENKGHTLHHVAVVKSMRKIGTEHSGSPFSTQVALKVKSMAGLRWVAFLQEPGNGHVLGAAEYAAQ